MDEITYPFQIFNGSIGVAWEGELFHPIFHDIFDYLSMMGLEFSHVSKIYSSD